MALSTKIFEVVADADHVVEAVGEPIPVVFHTITASARDGVDISPSGAVQVEEGKAQTFVVTAQVGFQIKSITVDGVEIPLS